ncbi:PP2C family protein-serine/threonine phosphatase [Cupriavidus neocaledonicus]|uniref:Putative Serine/threonine protein phosphatase n=1 Tax=Cupriavidus neocaledonicus TaxID=1040979 RepID=A0A375H4V6_9BURK|nr:hypothetical protein [Cupriavidus neocaledonicus]SPD46712.1 putative Serine/threonine protein phosphatase [Cupriavidus neocaledonicus]
MNHWLDEIGRVIASSVCRDVAREYWGPSWRMASSRHIESLGVAVGTHPGLLRSRNEDRHGLVQVTSLNGERLTAAILCDGVGGSEMGDAAASIAIATIIGVLVTCSRATPVKDLLSAAIRASDDSVRSLLHGRGTTTLSIILGSAQGQIVGANVGDSRIFSWQFGELTQLSIDDTLENELKRLPAGDMSALRARGLMGSLSQAIGETGRTANDLKINFIDGEKFPKGAILASDGAWKEAPDGFNAILAHAELASDAMRRVIAFATWAGGTDNISLIAIDDVRKLVRSVDWNDPVESRRGRATVLYGDTKLVLMESGERAMSGSLHNERQAKPVDTHDAPKRPSKPRKNQQARKKPLEPKDDDSRQLAFDVKADEQQGNEQHQAPIKPKVEISTDRDD